MTEPTPQPAAPQPAAPLTEAEDKQWASFAHFGGVLGFLPSLIIFLVFKDRGALTKQESKEALNWQITWTIAAIALAIIVGIINAVMIGAATLGNYGMILAVSGLLTFITWLPWLINAVLSIIGGVKVNGGGTYRYPVNFRFIK